MLYDTPTSSLPSKDTSSLTLLSSRDRMLAYCQEALRLKDVQYYYSWGAPEEEWIHGHHRLLILLEGECFIQYYRGGMVQKMAVKAPVMLFCPTNSYLRETYETLPARTISLGYMHDYIRTMHINTDGINEPPTDRDTFYHTDRPLGKGGEKLLDTIDTLIQEGATDEIISGLLWQLLKLTIGVIRQSDAKTPVKSPHRLWSIIMQHLRNHCGEQISRENVAHLVGCSPGYISKLMKQYSDSTFSKMQLTCRLEHAAMLLRKTTMNVSEVAFNCGFNYVNYFIRRFRAQYGMTPFAYRNLPEEHQPSKPQSPV